MACKFHAGECSLGAPRAGNDPRGEPYAPVRGEAGDEAAESEHEVDAGVVARGEPPGRAAGDAPVADDHPLRGAGAYVLQDAEYRRPVRVGRVEDDGEPVPPDGEGDAAAGGDGGGLYVAESGVAPYPDARYALSCPSARCLRCPRPPPPTHDQSGARGLTLRGRTPYGRS